MQKRRPTPALGERIARLTGRPSAAPTAPVRKRRVPRREIEARRQRLLRWGVAIAGGLVVLVLVAGALNEYVLKPNAVLASVGGVDIRRRDYWKVRAVDLQEQASQYQQFAALVGPDQQAQYQNLAQTSLAQIPEVWGSTDTDRFTLQRMIDDQLYLQGLDDLGLEVTDAAVETYALNRFAPPDAPLLTPPPTPTLTPPRAAAATETAIALAGSPTPVAATPAPGATPLAEPPPSPTLGRPSVVASPAASPVASPAASAAASPAASPVASEGTPSPAEARATAEAGFDRFAEEFFPLARLSRDDYLRLIARPAVARAAVENAIAAEVGQSAEQVHAAHILVATKDLADELYQRVTAGGEDFAAVARETSTDEATAGNGGDLGWFAREEMVPAFSDVAFALEPGQVSEPFQTEFGWHLVKSIERADDRPLTDAQINRIEQARVAAWLDERRAEIPVESSLGPTPTPAPGAFQPPVGAPPPPTPTPLPPATPEPVASPAVPATPSAEPAA